MMDKTLKLGSAIAIACCLLASLLCLTGCSSKPETESTNTVLVIAPCANQPAASSAVIGDVAEEAATNLKELAVVVAEGEPYVALPAMTVGSTAESNTSRSLENDAIIANLKAFVQGLRAQTPEVDFIGALELAAREARTMDGDASIVMFGSGISTEGLLRMQDTSLDISPTDIVEDEELCKNLPDLSGLQIDWYYMGDTARPQDQPGKAQTDNLEAVWQAIIEQAGGTVTFHDDVPTSDYSSEELPTVSCVDVSTYTMDYESRTVELPGSSSFGFEPDTADLVDAQSAAEEIAQLISSYPDIAKSQIVVTGYTASLPSASAETLDELGLNRAEAIKNLLVEAGVPSGSITCATRGSRDNVGERYDIDDATGLQIEEKAQANRRVVIEWKEQ